MKRFIITGLMTLVVLVLLNGFSSCRKEEILGKTKFVYGADLSYVNQILDHGGVYQENGRTKDPYLIFRDHGANLVRLRLWHNPVWTKDVYGNQGVRMYNDLADVKLAIRRSRDVGLAVNLDIHYSDTWADPSKQGIPAAWAGLNFDTLIDSVYQYTFLTLMALGKEGLMPEMVQIGNEINPGMLLPSGNCYAPGGWVKLGELINAGIRAVRDASAKAAVKPMIILHVAQPENVKSWFTNITTTGSVSDFDILGFSYYSKWSNVAMNDIARYVSEFKRAFKKEVMVVETAYPWTSGSADTYGNIFGAADEAPGYPLTPEGQLKYLTDLTRSIRKGGGMGIMVWEPAWISSASKDLWGTGSAWENCTFFDFGGNVNKGIGFMKVRY